MAEVLDGEVSPERLRDRLVLIGPLAPSLNDFFYTPYSQNLWGGLLEGPDRMSGVEFQAHLTSQVISAALDDRPLIRVWPSLWEMLWIVAWTSGAAVFYWRWRQSAGGLLVMLAGWIVLAGLGYGAFLWGVVDSGDRSDVGPGGWGDRDDELCGSFGTGGPRSDDALIWSSCDLDGGGGNLATAS